jgi:hypothetical protein
VKVYGTAWLVFSQSSYRRKLAKGEIIYRVLLPGTYPSTKYVPIFAVKPAKMGLFLPDEASTGKGGLEEGTSTFSASKERIEPVLRL